uniref:Uncharacterized protein n=1 Tax=Arundo donax TaxID=35708 RepID=A0A0A9C8J6_ARUDO
MGIFFHTTLFKLDINQRMGSTLTHLYQVINSSQSHITTVAWCISSLRNTL